MEANQQKTFQILDTTATKRIFDLKKRIRAVAGGTSASKTVSILIWLIDYCQSPKNRSKVVSVVSESYPHLQGGAMRDFKMIMKDRGYWNDDDWNETKHVYKFGQDNIMEFIAINTFGKAHGPRRDVLFINEANNLRYTIADQMMTRTRETIWLDWNPTVEFWFYTEIIPNRNDYDFITLTYKDNEALDETTVREIESHKHNKRWWQVYGLGQLGEVEGRVYQGWNIIDEIPYEAGLRRYGLDFGYTNDPSALVAIYYYNGGYILDEKFYQYGMSNREIAETMKNFDAALTIADSAEPKSIDEIKKYGINIIPAVKGQGSVLQGIQYVQDQKVSVTSRSVNIIKEYRNYMWQKDREDRTINKPQDFLDHTMDAVRYAINSFRPIKKKTGPVEVGGVGWD